MYSNTHENIKNSKSGPILLVLKKRVYRLYLDRKNMWRQCHMNTLKQTENKYRLVFVLTKENTFS